MSGKKLIAWSLMALIVSTVGGQHILREVQENAEPQESDVTTANPIQQDPATGEPQTPPVRIRFHFADTPAAKDQPIPSQSPVTASPTTRAKRQVICSPSGRPSFLPLVNPQVMYAPPQVPRAGTYYYYYDTRPVTGWQQRPQVTGNQPQAFYDVTPRDKYWSGTPPPTTARVSPNKDQSAPGTVAAKCDFAGILRDGLKILRDAALRAVATRNPGGRATSNAGGARAAAAPVASADSGVVVANSSHGGDDEY
ncbi:uncharacterized protein LOC106636477 [Copidosoma floridanum]|uniref:uncharacterized protein LOC106636477 n=1 Tax=Copidosoma floridanum TaxID=29053 RepID=UPI0006C9C3C9|nr:uncharacterized protein LOC106636477 [Copidosoma floridanum]